MEIPRLEVWLGALLVGLVAPLGVCGAGKWVRCVEWDSWVGFIDQDALRSHSFMPKPGHALLLSVLRVHSAMGNGSKLAPGELLRTGCEQLAAGRCPSNANRAVLSFSRGLSASTSMWHPIAVCDEPLQHPLVPLQQVMEHPLSEFPSGDDFSPPGRAVLICSNRLLF